MARTAASGAPRPPANRYEYERAGALVHLDAKKLGRFWQIGKRILGDGFQRNRRVGWQHAHVAVDDHSRLVVCSSTRARTPPAAPPSSST